MAIVPPGRGQGAAPHGLYHWEFARRHGYEWVILATAALCAFFTGPGQTFSLSSFVDHSSGDLGISRAWVSTAFSSATTASGLLMTFVGKHVDQIGTRRACRNFGVLLGLGCLWNSQVTGPLGLSAGFLAVRLCGQGAVSLVARTLVIRWFTALRGRALAIMGLGFVASQTLVPLINAACIDAFGWRATWRVWAALLCCVFVPISQLLILDSPDQLPRRQKSSDNVKAALSGPAAPSPGGGRSRTLAQAMGTLGFWVVLGCAFWSAFVNTSIIFHMSSLLVSNGMDGSAAPRVLSMKAAVGIPGSFLASILMEHTSARLVLALSLALQAVMLLMFAHGHWVTTASLVFGAASTFGNISSGVVLPELFGAKHIGSIQGACMTGSVIGSALGPLLLALWFEEHGDYSALSVSCLPSLGLLLLVSSLTLPREHTGETRIQ